MSATLPVGDAVTAMPVVAAHAAVVEMKPAAPQNPNQAAADVRLAVDAIRLANVGDHLGNYVEEQIVAAVANVDAPVTVPTTNQQHRSSNHETPSQLYSIPVRRILTTNSVCKAKCSIYKVSPIPDQPLNVRLR